jgi:hypothetical protein
MHKIAKEILEQADEYLKTPFYCVSDGGWHLRDLEDLHKKYSQKLDVYTRDSDKRVAQEIINQCEPRIIEFNRRWILVDASRPLSQGRANKLSKQLGLNDWKGSRRARLEEREAIENGKPLANLSHYQATLTFIKGRIKFAKENIQLA